MLKSYGIGLNIDKENELHIGSFDPKINELIGINKCLLIGNFGENVKTALNENLSILRFKYPRVKGKDIPYYKLKTDSKSPWRILREFIATSEGQLFISSAWH